MVVQLLLACMTWHCILRAKKWTNHADCCGNCVKGIFHIIIKEVQANPIQIELKAMPSNSVFLMPATTPSPSQTTTLTPPRPVPPEYFWVGWLWAVLLVFHVTVTHYIALQVHKRNYFFKSVFFKLYLLHALANYGVVVPVETRH